MLSVNRGLRQLFSESPTKRDCQRGPLPKLLSHHPGKDPTNYEADQGSSVPGQLPGRWNDVLIFVWRAEIYAELREVNDDLQEFDQKSNHAGKLENLSYGSRHSVVAICHAVVEHVRSCSPV
jgi:hypothetical protein